MRTPAVPVFVVLAAGTLAALGMPGGATPWLAAGAVAAWQLALLAFVTARVLLLVAAALASMALSASAAATHVEWQRRHAPILAWASPLRAEPAIVEGVLAEDASLRLGGGAGFLLRVRRVRGAPVDDGVMVSVGGEPDPAVVRTWTRGRWIRAPVLLRRATRYLNDGVPDAERASMRRGVALAGSVKSAALVEVVRRASWPQEALARTRASIRDTIAAALPRDPAAAAIVTAILIGDRAGLADDVERRMQRAGTYHVIAISGGNIALFAMLAWSVCRIALRSRRVALCGAMFMIAAYGLLVGTGASVARAVAAALVFLLAAVVDHRAPPINVIAVVGAGFLLWDPLALVDLGFMLSFGATAGILLAVPSWTGRLNRIAGARASDSLAMRGAMAAASMVAATAAAEMALLPVQALAFQRVTVAGLFLNLIAIPSMAAVQIAGLVLLAVRWLEIPWLPGAAAAVARLAARALVDSASIVDAVPALTWRVAAPAGWLTGAYVLACAALACAALAWRRWPRAHGMAAAIAFTAGMAIATSSPERAPPERRLRLSLFDVGQGEAILLKLPSGRSLLVDAAGAAGRFDIGDRVLVPALLARGVTRLDWLILTHADLDHVGGALSVIADLRPARVLEGVAVLLHPDRNRVIAAAASSGASIESLRAGGSLSIDGVSLNVLHPPEPEWERQAVRNDDSVVIDVRFGAISILLTGDAGELVEAALIERLTPAAVRILKAGHHGSRTATSQKWLDAARPDAALISAGRDNVYGHPSPVVLDRLRGAGAETFRTDVDGQIDLVTDGRTVEISTWRGRRWGMTARQSRAAR